MLIRSGTVLHWDTPMPTVPRRQKHESPKRGDNVGAIRRARGQYLDVNITIMAGEIWLAHYPTPGRNGYTRVVDGNRVRRMKWRERRRHGDRWGKAGIQRWRRPNGEAPLTLDQGLRECGRCGTVAILEAKSPAFAVGTWAQRAVAACIRADHPAWFKTLPTMRGAQGKVARFREAKGQIALIYGKRVRGRIRRLLMTRRVARTWTTQPNATW
jgi:hypothetical protein